MSQTQRQHFLSQLHDLINNYTDKKLIKELNEFYSLIEEKKNKTDKLMPKVKSEIDKYLESVKKYVKLIFEKYPDINYYPLETWGRYYKYESAGDNYRDEGEEQIINPEAEINGKWQKCLTDEQADIIDNDDEVKKWKEKYDYYLEDEELIKKWEGDERGAVLLYMDRNLNHFVVKSDTNE